MISCDSLPDVYWFYYCYIVFHNRRGDTSPHLLLFYRISWVYRRVSPLLWTITSSWLSAWRRGEIKGDNIVSGNWCGEKVKRWKGEKVKSWCFRQNRKGEKVKKWKSEIVVFSSKSEERGRRSRRWGTASCELGIITAPPEVWDNKNTEYKKNSSPPTGGKLYADEGCGENRIRTCEPVLPVTRFPGVPLQPLEHLSFSKNRCKITENIVCRRMLPIIIMKN